MLFFNLSNRYLMHKSLFSVAIFTYSNNCWISKEDIAVKMLLGSFWKDALLDNICSITEISTFCVKKKVLLKNLLSLKSLTVVSQD